MVKIWYDGRLASYGFFLCNEFVLYIVHIQIIKVQIITILRYKHFYVKGWNIVRVNVQKYNEATDTRIEIFLSKIQDTK